MGLSRLKRMIFCDRTAIPGMCLLGCWIAGLFLGLLAARSFGNSWVDTAQLLARSPLTLNGCLVTALFPLFISACAVVLFRGIACCGCCLARGIGQGFTLGVIAVSCTQGAALMAFFLMFSRLLENPVMLFYWLRRLKHGTVYLLTDTALCGFCLLLIGLGNYQVIAPFFAEIIN